MYDRLGAIDKMAKARKMFGDDENGAKGLTAAAVIDLLDEQSKRIITRPEDVAKALNGDAGDGHIT